jgi:hypothetical protein
VVPLVDDFELLYADEYEAFEELVELIGVITEEEVTGEENEPEE